MRLGRLGALSIGIALFAACERPARATQDFPGVVVQTLGLPGITIDAPQGCRLCHATDAGGTALRPFGTLMQQYGTQPYQESTVKAALAAVEQSEPQLIDDIKAGRDPNDDTGAANVHSPEYGCAMTRTKGASTSSWTAVSLAAAVIVRRRRSRRSRGGRRRAP